MPNYNLGKVYKIECLNDDNSDIYVGSTCEPYLSNRLAGHKRNYKCFLEGKIIKNVRSYQLFEKYGIDNCVITLLELVNCESKAELLQRERHYIKILQCVNKNIPSRTVKEYYIDNKDKICEGNKQYYIDNTESFKQYYIDNKDKMNEVAKQYYIDNKTRIHEHNNIKFNCVCGGRYTHSNTASHLKTRKHQQYLCQSI